MIITVASQKGGSGKTTVAINLALVIAGLKNKYRVALVDADQQRSVTETLQGHERDNLTLYESTEKTHRLIESIKGEFDMIFIDTPGHSNEGMYQAASVSDLVIIPLKPSPLDVRAMAITVKAVTFIQEKYNPGMLCRFLVNMVNPRSVLAQEIRATLEKFYPFPAFTTMLQEREIYKRSLVSGKSVLEYDKGKPAAKEIRDLFAEIDKLTKNRKTLKHFDI